MNKGFEIRMSSINASIPVGFCLIFSNSLVVMPTICKNTSFPCGVLIVPNSGSCINIKPTISVGESNLIGPLVGI